LSVECSDGLIHYALGPPLRYVPLKQVLETPDPASLERLFRDRIVLIGEVQPFSDRIAVPVNLAEWEPIEADSPAIVVHALTLRTALLAAAPAQASRPLVVVLLSLAALLFLMRNWRTALAAGSAAAAVAFGAALVALRGGHYVPVASILFTLLVAWAARAAVAFRATRRFPPRPPNIRHSR
jgi:CHASE2 domain-containing sensor protein